MLRWILLAVLVVAVSAAIPLVVMNMPTDEAGAKLIVAPDKERRQGPQGKLFVEGEPVHDFGLMAQWAKDTKTWTVKNVGEGDLDIWLGSSTCMCTVAELDRDPKTQQKREKLVLAPGEETVLTVSWNTKDRQGAFEQGTSIGTSDPEVPDFWFRVVGEVQPPILTDPQGSDLNFLSIPNSAPQTQPMLIASPDRPELKITEIQSSNPDSVMASVRPMTEEELKQANSSALKVKAGYRATIEAKPLPVLGNFEEEIVFKTDHPQRPEVRVKVRGRRVGPIDLVPESAIVIRDASTPRGGSRNLMLNVRDGQDTHFEVDKTPEGLQVTIDPVDNQGRGESKVRLYKLTASVPPGTPAGEIKGSVIVKTDHPQVGELKIPVEVVVMSRAN